MFNKNFGNTSTFGTGSTFGTSTPFGQTATSTFGQRPATSNVFGASTFGAPQATGFGAPQTSTNLFGFGQQAPATGMQQSTGFFGNTGQAAPSTSLFGSTPSSTSAFNMSRPTFGGFGTSTNLFGAQPQPQAQATPLFGQTAAAPGTSTVFGAGFGSTATGTTIKFNPPTGTDTMVKNGTNQNIHTRHQCITCMKEYENKSFEELRIEDYAANRKGSTVMPFSGTAGAAQPGLFNQPSTSGFSFGPKPLFGTTTQANTMTGFGTQGTTSMFGAAPNTQANLFNKAPTPFGTAATSTSSFSFSNPAAATTAGGSLFGASTMQPQSKSLFGTTNPGTGMFGAASTTTTTPAFGTTGGMFSNTGTFGATAANANPFGVKPATFGATSTAAPSTGFGFGAAAPAQTTSLFGQPRPTGTTFGTPAFGTSTSFGGFQNTQSTGLFGQQQKPIGTAFGTTPFGSTGTTAFGAGTTGFTGFGTSTAPSLFSNTQANKPAFSFNNPASFTGFGAPTLGATNPLAPAAPQLMDQQAMAAVQMQIQQHVMALNSLPYGDSPLFRNMLKDGKEGDERLKPTNPAAQRSILTSASTKPPDNKVLSLRPAIKIKPTPSTASSKLSLFADLEDLDDLSMDRLLSPRSSNKKLYLSKPPVASITASPLVVPSTSTATLSNGDVSYQPSPPLNFIQNPAVPGSNQDSPHPARQLSCSLNDTIRDLNIHHQGVSSPPLESPRESRLGLLRENETDSSIDLPTSPAPPVTPSSSSDKLSAVATSPPPPHPTGIVLTRYGYYTVPSLDQLATMKDDTGAILVEKFTVGREGYGNVVFPEKINVANLNLDEIVFFRRKEITLYLDDEKKPPVGTELNRRAQITLDCVWPSDKNTRQPIMDPERLRAMNYVEKLEQATTKLGAKFVEYRPETGSWVFTVKHFSKYGLMDESDDEESVAQVPNLLLPPHINESTQTNGLAPLPPAPPIKELTTIDNQSFGGILEEMYPPPPEPISFDVEMLTPSLLIKTSEKIEQMKFLFEEDQDLDVDPQMEMGRGDMLVEDAVPSETPVPLPRVSPPRSPVFEPEPLGPLIPTKRLLLRPLSRSKLAQRTRLLQDASLFMARSFRVGHGPNLRLACPGLVPADDVYDPIYPFSYHLPRAHLLKNHSVISLKTPSFCSPFLEAPTPMKELVRQLLHHQLSHSIRSQEPDGTPYYVPAPGTASFGTYVDLAQKYCSSLSHHDYDLGFARQFSAALRLVQALWGELPGANSQGPYAYNLKRREALTKWLVDSTRHQLDDQLRSSGFETNVGDSSDVFNYLTCHQLSKAIAAAQRNQDYRIAILVAAHRDVSKAALQKQLMTWKDFKMDQFIEKSRLKVYALLAGKLVWTTSKGVVNCCENLDWKRAFAVHLWYSCPSNDDITAAVRAYQEAFQPSDPHAESYAVPPYPPYIEDSLAEACGLEGRHQDVCYHLLQLYSGRGRPATLLCPTTAVHSEVDVRLSWVLHQLLRGLGLVPASDFPVSDRLHLDWATQLELLGLWPWAVFALLHLSQPARRRSAVLDLLARHASLEPDAELRNFLCVDLGVPPSWLAHAQAIRARYEGQAELEARFLQEAGQMAESHHLVVTSLAAELIVNERHRDLRTLLEPLASAGSIPGWSSGGKLLLDWLDMVALLEELSCQGGGEQLCLERLEPQVVDVAMKVCAYSQGRTPKERLCQCMMAQKAFLLLQMVIRSQALSNGGGAPAVAAAGASLLRLLKEALLPEDCALQQLQSLVRTYLLQFAH